MKGENTVIPTAWSEVLSMLSKVKKKNCNTDTQILSYFDVVKDENIVIPTVWSEVSSMLWTMKKTLWSEIFSKLSKIKTL